MEEFLPSVIHSVNGMDAEVIVADNASTDNSLEFLKTNHPKVRTIVLDKKCQPGELHDIPPRFLLLQVQMPPVNLVLPAEHRRTTYDTPALQFAKSFEEPAYHKLTIVILHRRYLSDFLPNVSVVRFERTAPELLRPVCL